MIQPANFHSQKCDRYYFTGVIFDYERKKIFLVANSEARNEKRPAAWAKTGIKVASVEMKNFLDYVLNFGCVCAELCWCRSDIIEKFSDAENISCASLEV